MLIDEVKGFLPGFSGRKTVLGLCCRTGRYQMEDSSCQAVKIRICVKLVGLTLISVNQEHYLNFLPYHCISCSLCI